VRPSPPLNAPHPAGTDADAGAGARQCIAGGEAITAPRGHPGHRELPATEPPYFHHVDDHRQLPRPDRSQDTPQAVGTHPSAAVAGPAKPIAANTTIQARPVGPVEARASRAVTALVRRAVLCPGCGKTIEVQAEGYPPVIVRRSETDDGHPAVGIQVGTIDVHGCVQFPGGRWAPSGDH